MFADWKEETSHVKKSFGALGKQYPKMLQAYQALGASKPQKAMCLTLKLVNLSH